MMTEKLNEKREKPKESSKISIFECNICQKSCKKKSNLDVHMRVHTGEKPHECIVCQRRFSHKSALSGHMLTLHMKTTSGENPHEMQRKKILKCEICHYICYRQDHMKATKECILVKNHLNASFAQRDFHKTVPWHCIWNLIQERGHTNVKYAPWIFVKRPSWLHTKGCILEKNLMNAKCVKRNLHEMTH